MSIQIKRDHLNRIMKLCIKCCIWLPATPEHFAVEDTLKYSKVCRTCRESSKRYYATRYSKIAKR